MLPHFTGFSIYSLKVNLSGKQRLCLPAIDRVMSSLHCKPSRHLYACASLPLCGFGNQAGKQKVPAGHRVYDACRRLSEHICRPCQTGTSGYTYFCFGYTTENVSRYFPPRVQRDSVSPGCRTLAWKPAACTAAAKASGSWTMGGKVL